ncbi:MAG: GAF domain-containing protein [Stigonema ocellatum SAG 48.90 = DSM 106950]|nr:GAF domain-containing protein [Stigonema ocellatum SAG 48.90 = DSM 106950]
MFNKTHTDQSSDAENTASLNSSQKIVKVELSQQGSNERGANSLLNQVVAKVGQLSLSTKATILAIAIGTLPILAVGTLAYQLASQSITNKVTKFQEAQAQDLADKVNRFMLERYKDIQVIASLPTLTNIQARESTTAKEKQAVLDKFVDTYKVYDSIALFDLNGDVIVQSQGDSLPNQSDRSYFKAVRQTDSPFISGQPEGPKNAKALTISAPVKDTVTGKTIAIVRERMPVKYLENVIKNYAENAGKYFLSDRTSGNFFAASETYQIDRNTTTDFPGLDELEKTKQEQSFITIRKSDNKEYLVSSVSKTIEGLPNLNWQVLLATDTETAFETQRQLLLTIAIGTGLTALIVALIAAWLAKNATKPIVNATKAVARLGQGELNTRLEVQSEDELGVLSANINYMALQLQTLLKEKELDAEREKSLAEMTVRTRRSLKTEDVYKTAAREVRQALKTDRVVMYEFNPDTWDGTIVAESVNAGFPRMLGVEIDDPCFRERHVETYKDGRVRAINNIYQDPNLSNAGCYIRMLEKFAVKANLVAPIISQGELVGLMIAHHCDSPRIWLQDEIDLFNRLAIQVGYALEQSTLIKELQKAKAVAETSSKDERLQKEAIQMQLLELLSEVEGAAKGDLTVRAEVTAGEIGTVADFFNAIVENLRDIVTQVKEAATKVNQAIGANKGAIRHLADEALSQAAEITHTLNAVDNMTHAMQEVAASAQQAATIAQNASRTAKKSGQAMDLTVQNILHLRETVGETAKKVKRLGESTQQITRVVALINQISMQTNLLAINAGIEAARAGEEGQGFAVVAEEVGELAARSAVATKEIEQIVENIQRETSDVVAAMELGTTQVVEGTRIVEEAKQSLSQILDVSRQIDSLVQSISSTTTSQVETSQTVRALMKDIAVVSQRTSNSSHQVSESLQQTMEISQQLQETVGTFKVN